MGRSRLAWALVVANLLAIAAVAWITYVNQPVETPPLRFAPTAFAALPGWRASDPRGALDAFRRSCTAILKRPLSEQLGWAGYAGSAASWLAPCKALPYSSLSAGDARAFFEKWFAPVSIDRPAHFTGYYEPELSGSPRPTLRYHIPIYGRPKDLVTADLGSFRHALEGEHIAGRLDGIRLVPYATRADIDAHGLATAPILLYTDDAVSAFFLQIQGSGLVKLTNGGIVRLAYAAKNGRPYTPIGRVLIAQGALARKDVSLQTIRAWLDAHPSAAQNVMQVDESFVFFEIAPLGDPALGSPGTEGISLTPGASLAVDERFHPLGAPVYVATTIPDPNPAKPDRSFQRLLIAQDTGGAIKGPARGDIFFGAGSDAESIAGRLNARGQFFVLIPRAAAAGLDAGKEFPDAPR
ncbi:MAG TPA: MltA domain-containing protein [Rhizomicrobium sp.]|nr:MltA domain-containing protein [Rhizomicrobium sp.]